MNILAFLPQLGGNNLEKLYSHYSTINKKELKVHLKNVAEKSRKIIESKKLNLSIIKQENLAELSYTIGLIHDFGKSTTYFQNYLLGDGSDIRSHHGLISAIFAYLFVKKEYNEVLAMVAYMIVKKHHGNLESPLEESDRTFYQTKDQIKNIKNKTYQQVVDIYTDLLKINESKFKEFIDELENFINNNFELSTTFEDIILFELSKNDEDQAVELFLLTNLLYSALIDSDKKDAARIDNDYFDNAIKESFDIEKYLVQKRKEKPDKFNPNKKINQERNGFLNEIINNPELDLDNKLYNLTAPTGIGKTFASFAFANKLRKDSKNGKRIIYCLPYTSIVDQNYSEYEKIINYNLKDEYEKNPTKYLLRHHYLSPLKIEKNIKNKDDSNQSKNLSSYLDEKLLLESWESANIVTTFVQLLESIIGNKNSYLKKFHNVVNSVIILDEVQNIPVKYYHLVGKVLKILGNKFNTHLLLMTATQPEIISGKEVIQLTATEYDKKEIFDRVNLNIIDDLKPQSIDDFILYLEDNFNYNNALVVTNTIQSALDIYKKLKEIFEEHQIFSLTTNLTPADREERINLIKAKIKQNEKIIVVSTQLIEAGVDISFEVVYRDFGPLDSIVQVAGRCNRSGELEEKGEVFIVKLKKENGKNYCKIYDKKLLDICENILEENKSFSELSKSYFCEIRASFKRSSNKLLSAIHSLNYSRNTKQETAIRDFKIIEDNRSEVDLIICQSKSLERKIEELKEIYEEIKTLNNNRQKLNILIARKELINKDLAKNRVSVYRNQLGTYLDHYNIINEFRFIKYVNWEDQKEYLYDKDIGFLEEPKKPAPSSLVF
jgi:CRISPR-associated endonuclease/helicase Cas3